MHKPQTSHLYRCNRGSDMHRGISARYSNVETHLCDREMPCGTYQTYDDTEVRTPSRSLRSSSQKADSKRA